MFCKYCGKKIKGTLCDCEKSIEKQKELKKQEELKEKEKRLQEEKKMLEEKARKEKELQDRLKEEELAKEEKKKDIEKKEVNEKIDSSVDKEEVLEKKDDSEKSFMDEFKKVLMYPVTSVSDLIKDGDFKMSVIFAIISALASGLFFKKLVDNSLSGITNLINDGSDYGSMMSGMVESVIGLDTTKILFVTAICTCIIYFLFALCLGDNHVFKKAKGYKNTIIAMQSAFAVNTVLKIVAFVCALINPLIALFVGIISLFIVHLLVYTGVKDVFPYNDNKSYYIIMLFYFGISIIVSYYGSMFVV